jgi:shikimate kinase
VAERLLLVGMMGAGKSTVARLAADRLGWTWIDTDTEVARAGGASVADLFARNGEAHFRQEEARAIAAALRRSEPLVISVGGGAVLDQGNRNSLRAAGTVVWLRAWPETLIERVNDGVGRPLLVGATPEERAKTLRQIEEKRRSLYLDVAHQVVDVDGLDADQVTQMVLQSAGKVAPDRGANP